MKITLRSKWLPHKNTVRYLAVLFLLSLLTACSSTGRAVDHSFSFDIRNAKPPVEVLNYRYGSSGMTGTAPPEWALKEGHIGQQFSVSGPFPVGDFLYVKWRLKETGEIFEKTVDLRGRLPKDMEGQRVCFYIVGEQLYIYVTDTVFLPVGAPEYLAPGTPSQNLPYTYHTKYRIVYPDQPKN